MSLARHFAGLLAICVGGYEVNAQACLHTGSGTREGWAAGTSVARYSYAQNISLFAERSGHILSLRGRLGQTSSAFLGVSVPEGAVALSGRVRFGELQACGFAGGFSWRGPTRPILGLDAMSSSGAGGGVETSYLIRINSRLVVVPYVTVSWDAVRTLRERRIPGLSSDSTARYTLRATEVGLSATIDNLLLLRVALQQPGGMPDETQLGPFGRKNGEHALILGASFVFGRQSQR